MWLPFSFMLTNRWEVITKGTDIQHGLMRPRLLHEFRGRKENVNCYSWTTLQQKLCDMYHISNFTGQHREKHLKLYALNSLRRYIYWYLTQLLLYWNVAFFPITENIEKHEKHQSIPSLAWEVVLNKRRDCFLFCYILLWVSTQEAHVPAKAIDD